MKDGDHWCFLLGSNLQEGVCGFGKTIPEAIEAFNKNYEDELIVIKKPNRNL